MSTKNQLNYSFYIFNFFIIFMLLFLQVQSKLLHHEEICGNFNGRRIYVELGNKGTVIAKNINNVGNIKKTDSYKQCRFELTSCPACVISVKFTFLNISQNCDKNPIVNSCTCDYVWVFEPPFHDISKHEFCGHYAKNNNSLLFYRSQTRTVSIIFFYTQPYQHAFTLQYESERNRQIIQGVPGNENRAPAMISTPFFPNPYLRDLNMEYLIRCNGSKNCRISLTFTDFLLAKMSVIEVSNLTYKQFIIQFFDWNGRRLNAATGMTFRPPAIISTGPFLNLRFYANGATDKGFKIAYTFLNFNDNNNNKNVIKSKMNCGGLVDNLGGGITMMNVVKEATQFDCVWIVQPSRNFVHFYKHLYLKVVVFSDFGGNAELSIHEGLTSVGARVEFLKYPFSNLDYQRHDQHIISISEGFYLRFKGVLGAESKLGIAYTAFGYNECIPGTDFLCQNQRCIPIYLQCDGFDHCGDNSDEPSSCFQDLKRHRWSHSSNFFFPKTDHYSDLHTAAIIFIVCCFGMISLILALIVLIFRVNGRARQQREMENHLQAISDFLDQDAASIQEEIIDEDDPPGYEAPPNYDEVGNDNNKFELPFNLTSTGRINNQESLKVFRRSTCIRCSQRLSRSKRPNTNISMSRPAENLGIGTSRVFQIPDSPPPAYLQILMNPELSEGIVAGTSFVGNYGYTINIENKQNFLAKHFSNEDFGILKKKVQQKIKKRKIYWKIEHAKKFFPNFCESDLNHCLSDSEVSENHSGNVDGEDDSSKMQRSFSFDDL